MPQLDFANHPFISQFFWLAVSFAVLYFYSAKVILPRISKILEMRAAAINDALADAERIKMEAEQFVQDGDSSLTEAREQAKEILEVAQGKMNLKIQSEIEKLDKEIDIKISDAHTEIKAFKKKSAKEIDQLGDKIHDNLIKKLVG